MLHQLALTAEPGTDHDTVAAHIAWWRDRSDFPAGRAVVHTTTHCRQRWITGTAPDAENDPATWRRWLGMTDDSTHGLLDLHTRLTAGTALDYLDTLAETDEWFYSTAQSHHNDGRDWRRPDSTYRAALGLRERCDAADLYAAALLTDPLHRRRAVHTGEVVLGTAHPLQGRLRSVEVTCARMDARLRPGADVTGWAGGPGISGQRFSGTVTTASRAQRQPDPHPHRRHRTDARRHPAGDPAPHPTIRVPAPGRSPSIPRPLPNPPLLAHHRANTNSHPPHRPPRRPHRRSRAGLANRRPTVSALTYDQDHQPHGRTDHPPASKDEP